MSAACPNCCQESALSFRTRDYNRHVSTECFDYYDCATCGLIFLHPVPTDLGKHYPSDYYTIPTSVEALARAVPAVRYKIEILKQFVRSGRLLEIGQACGDFAFL